jgi:hypothetical protein
MQKLTVYILCLFLLGACKKNDPGSENKRKPRVLLETPTNNQVFLAGQTVNITANIFAGIKDLAQIHVHIYNNATGHILIDMHGTPTDPRNYYLNETFQVQAGIQYKIEVVAINSSGDQGVETVLISAN